MKKTLVLSAAAMMLAGAAFAKESTLIDFSLLDADITVKMSDNDAGDRPNENKRTVMDYSIAAGATYSQEQRDLMKTSLFIDEWEVELNSSARNVTSLALSQVKAAPVRENAKVPFAGQKVMGVRIVFPS